AAYAEHGQIVIKDVPDPIAGPGQLLVAVKAAGLNAADRLIVNGHYVRGSSPRHAESNEVPSVPLGAEAAGEVVAIGDGVTGFAIGDRVMGVSGSAFAPFTLLGAALAMHIPEQLSFADAASVPTTFTPAPDALLSPGTLDLDELARKRVSLVGVSFRTRPVEEIMDVHHRAGEDIVPALAAGQLKVIVDRTFPFHEILAAQDWMQTGRQLGKVILTFD